MSEHDAPTNQHLVNEFHQAMLRVYQDAKRLAGYNATYFLNMINDHGGYETARRLLHTPNVPTGLTALWQKGQLSISMENVVLQERFDPLFTDDDRAIARQRLIDYGFRPHR